MQGAGRQGRSALPPREPESPSWDGFTLAQAAQLAADSAHESMRPYLGEAQRLDHMTPTEQDNEVTSSYTPDS